MIDLVPDMSNCLEPEEIFKQTQPSIVRIVSDEKTDDASVGTGLIVDKNGTVVTSAHVVDASKVIMVETALDGRREYVRKWVGNEYSVGVIVPKKTYAATVYIPLTRTSPVVGQQVYSTGYPFNIRLSYASGHVSAIFKEGTNSLVQLDMAIAPGMSGSPVFNCRAQPIGFILGHLSWSSNIGFANDVSEALAGQW